LLSIKSIKIKTDNMGKGFKLPGVSPLKQEGNSSTSLPQFDRSGYRSSGGSYSSPQSVIDTSQGNLLSSAIGTIGDAFSTAINPPNVNADGSTGSQNTTTTSRPVYNTNLDRRIANARARGDMSKVAKLEGRQDRRTQRDTAQKAINEKKANEKLAKQKERLVKKLDKKGFDGEEILSTAPVETKTNDSGINTDTSGANEKGATSLILTGQTDKAIEVVKQKRKQKQKIEQSNNTSNSPTEMKKESPLDFMPGQQMGQPQAFSYDVPMQANMMGAAKPVFNQQTMGMAEAAFGNPTMRQASVKSPFEVTAKQKAAFGPDSKLAKEDPAQAKKIYDGIKAGDNSPAASTYENPTPVVDHSGGYVAAKALDTFGNVFADAVTAKYGNKDNEE
jgi:hypothetical protein